MNDDTNAVNDDDQGIIECCICLTDIAINDARIIKTCSHIFCVECMQNWHSTNHNKTNCPLCRQTYGIRDLVDYTELRKLVTRNEEKSNDQLNMRESESEEDDHNTSIKLDYMLQELNDTHADEKTVIFSSFTSFLNIAEERLNSENINFVRIDGRMSIKNRVKAINRFNNEDGNDGPTVCLISLKAGGTGLNLTRANRCLMLDLWWNGQVDNQAIDRIYRIGQKRTVYVKKLIVKNTLEERILELQEYKEGLASGALGSEEISNDRLHRLTSLLD